MRKEIFYLIMVGMGLFFCQKDVKAQYIHFSQYHISPFNTNPALAGIFDGDQRFAALYRRQWYSVPVDYMTFSGSYDMKFPNRKNDNGFFSAGALFNYDKAGDSELSLGNFSLTGSYTKKMSENVYLSGGVQFGLGQRSFRENNLFWDNFWTGTEVDPSKGSGENFAGTSFAFFDLGAGVNLHFQTDNRSKIDLGVGGFHLTEPNHTFYEDADSKLPRRFTLNAMAVVQLAERFDLMANALGQFQGEYEEIVLSGFLNIHISTKKAREVQLALGIGTRLKDAIIPQFAIAYDGWRFGFSYDVNTSPFDVATDRKGGPEFSLIHIIKKVKPLDAKACRIF